MNINLSQKQLSILIQLVNCEQYTVTDDVLNEELNDLRRALQQRPQSKQQINAEYQSRHQYMPEFESTAQNIVEQHTPMPPNYPQAYTANDVQQCIANTNGDYAQCVDYMVQSMNYNENTK